MGVLKRFNKSKYIDDYFEVSMNMLKASIIEQYMHSTFYNLRFHFADLDNDFDGKMNVII
jgi:hypothetical protein